MQHAAVGPGHYTYTHHTLSRPPASLHTLRLHTYTYTPIIIQLYVCAKLGTYIYIYMVDSYETFLFHLNDLYCVISYLFLYEYFCICFNRMELRVSFILVPHLYGFSSKLLKLGSNNEVLGPFSPQK